MYPAELSDVVQSPAEVRLFERIRDETPDDWAALHSLGLKGHSRKLWAEADFVLVTPTGVWVLEVKGGSLARHGRKWFQQGREMRQSPFDQGGGAAGALRRDLQEHVEATRRSCIAHGVVFPDVVFEEDGPDIVPEIVYDARDLDHPFEGYVGRLADYWHGRLERDVRPLSPAARSVVLHRLAGDFDLIRSLRSTLSRTAEELVRLTDQQRTAVEGLAENPRVVVQGGAGTGKTLLAVNEAERLANKGERVLLCCHSRRLAGHLRDTVGRDPAIETIHYFGLLSRLIGEGGLRDQLPDASERDLFDVFYPAVALDALDAVDESWSFDALVLDEAQDIMLSTHLEVFDGLLKRGLEEGTWRVFVDPHQDVFHGAGGDARRRLSDCATQYRLGINCRNTVPIAIQAALLGGHSTEDTLAATGEEVDLHFYDDPKEMLHSLGQTLKAWIEGGVQTSEISVLSPRGRDRSCLADGMPPGVPAVLWESEAEEAQQPERPANAVEFATVASFKGLEATAIAFVDLEGLTTEWQQVNAYIAVSRATSLLALWLPADLRETYAEMSRRLGERDRQATPVAGTGTVG